MSWQSFWDLRSFLKPHQVHALEASPTHASDAGLVESPKAWRVLVAEDHELSRRVAGVLLQSLGHRVSFAENGEQALAQVVADDFDLVLMDIHMPVMDGWTSARLIRDLPGKKGRVPMVGLTADLQEALVEKALAAGMMCVLPKPLQKTHLENLVCQPTGGADAVGA